MKNRGPVVIVDHRKIIEAPKPVIPPKPIKRPGSSISDVRGRKMWKELHERALLVEGEEDGGFIQQFLSQIPCGECRNHFKATLQHNPPNWKRYFAWSVDIHNEVNVRLGKEQISEVSARLIWSKG